MSFLEHLVHAGQIVGWCDAEGELEGAGVCCGISEATLAGKVVCRIVGVLHE